MTIRHSTTFGKKQHSAGLVMFMWSFCSHKNDKVIQITVSYLLWLLQVVLQATESGGVLLGFHRSPVKMLFFT